MSFEVDRYTPAWAHVALCADLTWASEPPDDFIIANQRLLAQHCRVSQILHDRTAEAPQAQARHCETAEKRIENSPAIGRRSVKDVIPESRLAKFYGNFYYDEHRESCYTSPNEIRSRPYCAQGCESSDVTECWMLPEVEYWFRKLMTPSECSSSLPRRRRQCRASADDASERWSPTGPRDLEEASLEARVRSVRQLWQEAPHRPAPPQPARKMRARRRQPRRLTALAPPPPFYCLDAPAQLVCDPTCKFHFETPRPPLADCQRVMSRYTASMQAMMRATAARCPLYRGTNVSRYAPTGPRPLRCTDRRCIWWPRDHQAQQNNSYPKAVPPACTHRFPSSAADDDDRPDCSESTSVNAEPDAGRLEAAPSKPQATAAVSAASPSGVPPADSEKKRLYSTVLSTSAPMSLPGACVRLSKLSPGILKLNPKMVVQTRLRSANVANKFEELEQEALEQYKASDESIGSKLRQLEQEAVEQYSASNSNTSCSSGHSAGRREEAEAAPHSRKDKAVDSVVIYSHNFPDLNARGHSSVTNLKNSHAPHRGEKKEQTHRASKALRAARAAWQRAGSATDYEAHDHRGTHKGGLRWPLHAVPKKRHLSACASDLSSDDDAEETPARMRDGPRAKGRLAGALTMCAHGAGDLQPIARKA